MTLLSIGWLLLLVLVALVGTWFAHLYWHDGDKRKFMFALAFWSSSMSYLVATISSPYDLVYGSFLQNLYNWAAVPIMVAIFIAVTESFHRMKDFDKVFKVFLVSLFFCFTMVLLPVYVEDILVIIRHVIASWVIIASCYVFIKSRQYSSLMFLLSMACFTFGGITLAKNLEELSIFSNFMAYIFLTQVFIAASHYVKKDEFGIDPYFSLERKLETTEKALHESEERYKKIALNTSDVIMITQPDGIISYLSPSSEMIFGYKPDELIGQQLRIIHPKDFERVKKIYHQASKGSGSSNLEYRIKTKHGETKWVSHSFSPIWDGSKLRMIVSSVRDITDLKITEKKLREKAEALEKNKKATLSIIENLKTAREELKSIIVFDLKIFIQQKSAEA